MSGVFGAWILRLTGAALLAAAADALAPEGAVKRAVRLVCGAVVLLALLSLAADFDYSGYAARLSAYRSQAERILSAEEDDDSGLVRAVIEKELESYILDKARECGAGDAQADVTAVWSTDGCWYPESVRVTGTFSAEQRAETADFIESELGVPAEEQDWSGAENEEAGP